jgi:uncharacterized protein YjiS (DUF1127 family)
VDRPQEAASLPVRYSTASPVADQYLRRGEPEQSTSRPVTAWHRIDAAFNSAVDSIVEGFALYGLAMHGDCLGVGGAHGHGKELHRADVRWSGMDVSEASSPWETTRIDAPGWGARIASSLRRFRSSLVRARENRRRSVGWEMLDDRMLKDIGVDRHEIEFVERLEHPRW